MKEQGQLVSSIVISQLSIDGLTGMPGKTEERKSKMMNKKPYERLHEQHKEKLKKLEE
jgi:hypothetical protein